MLIKNRKELKQSLKRLDEIFDSGNEESVELSKAIEAYEKIYLNRANWMRFQLFGISEQLPMTINSTIQNRTSPKTFTQWCKTNFTLLLRVKQPLKSFTKKQTAVKSTWAYDGR